MDYASAVRYLLSLGRELAAPTQAAAAKFDLENTTILLECLGRPDRAYPTIHIAGTNGKGSTAAFVESILRQSGFRTGLNSSPHLERINERFRINGEEITDEQFAETFTRIHSVIEELLADGKLRAHPTYFECVTALAFEVFARARVEFGVIEVGLGGRLDATNVITPVVSVITRIDFDHENFLGHSLHEIAGEKAGIIKHGVPVVSAPQFPEAQEVLRARARELRCQLIETSEAFRIDQQVMEAGNIRAQVTELATSTQFSIASPLSGRFQLQNALNAVAAVRLLRSKNFRVTKENIERGIAEALWPGRLEKLHSNPDIYLDGAHNPGAARELARFLEENFAGRRLILIYGAMRDKAVDEVAGLLFPLATEVVFTQPNNSRAVSASQLAQIAGHHAAHFSVVPNAEAALQQSLALTHPGTAIFITGSLYLVGQLRHAWTEGRSSFNQRFNRAIEIHDSELESVVLRDARAELHFSSAYIHQSAGRPGIDAGSEWVQRAILRIADAEVKGAFSEFPVELTDGQIQLGDTQADNEIPIPLKHKGKFRLTLQPMWQKNAVTFTGSAAELELIGEAEYVQGFSPGK